MWTEKKNPTGFWFVDVYNSQGRSFQQDRFVK